LNKDNNVTTGKVYQHVIEKEVSLGSGHTEESILMFLA
jgi:CTP synthase (UTP-ammonia lyase)